MCGQPFALLLFLLLSPISPIKRKSILQFSPDMKLLSDLVISRGVWNHRAGGAASQDNVAELRPAVPATL